MRSWSKLRKEHEYLPSHRRERDAKRKKQALPKSLLIHFYKHFYSQYFNVFKYTVLNKYYFYWPLNSLYSTGIFNILTKCFHAVENVNIFFFIFYGFFSSLPKDIFIDFRERGTEREREQEKNIDVREKHQWAPPHTCPMQGLYPQPKYVPWLGIKHASNLLVQDDTTTKWATQPEFIFFLLIIKISFYVPHRKLSPG